MSKQFRWTPFYTKGSRPEIPPIAYRHLPDMMKVATEKYKDQTAFLQYMPNGMTAEMTFGRIDQLSSAFALVLREKLKLKTGDRVAIQMPNCLTYPIVVFGILKAGLVLVNTNPLYTAPEMNHQFKDSGAKAVIVMDMFADRLPQGIKSTSVEQIIVVSIAEYFSFLPKLLITSVLKYIKKQIPEVKVAHESYDELMKWGEREIKNRAASHLETYLADVSLDSTAALQYTGGTTGVSKAAVLSHRNIISNSLQILEMVAIKIDFGKETIITALPLYHIFAFSVNLIAFYYAGARNILVPSPRPLTNLKKVMTEVPFTWLTGVNTLFNGLTNESWFQKDPPKHLKMSVAGGMALHRSTAERWQKISGSSIAEGYGLTEASPVLNVNPIGGATKDGTIGIPIPSTEVRCLDEQGNEVAIGQPGELCARGPQIMKEYWKQPQETAKVLIDGWLHTGDIAIMDEQGYFSIVDRKKDMILVSGFNVYPNEIEDCIAKHPKVAEVAVIGIPDDQAGEIVRAYIHPKDESLTIEEIRDHCKQSLTNYKIPRSIIFRKDLPKNPIGKILRKDLRAESLQELKQDKK